jgi:hypothetical protein
MKSFSFICALLFVCSTGSAQPTLFNDCQDIPIHPVPGGAGVFFSDDCKTAYVLPAATGSLTITGMTVSENLRRCPMFESYTSIMAQQADRLEKLAKQISASGVDTSENDSTLFPGPASGGSSISAEDMQQLLKDFEDVKKLNVDINDTIKDYLQLEGSTAQGILNADQTEMVNAYEKANPSIHMVALTVEDAHLHINKRVAGISAGLPAVLEFSVPGRHADDPGGDPGGEAHSLFGGIVSGQLVLSLVGACPYYDATTHRMKVDHLDGQSLAPYFNANVDYWYGLAVNRSYHAEYNMGEFISRIQSSESHGGFFTSSTINKLIEEKDSHDWFTFKANSQDGRFDFADALRETVKAQLIDRALRQIQMMSLGSGTAAPGFSTPGADGASVAAENLRKCPYIYCQVGAAVLDVANAIFGGSEAVAEFIQNNNHWQKDDVSETQMLPFLGSTVFQEEDSVKWGP